MQSIAGGSISSVECAHTFCVVCGCFSDDLVLRTSGLKCTGCVGKRASREWMKLQKRQATQLLSHAVQQNRMIPGSLSYQSSRSCTSEPHHTLIAQYVAQQQARLLAGDHTPSGSTHYTDGDVAEEDGLTHEGSVEAGAIRLHSLSRRHDASHGGQMSPMSSIVGSAVLTSCSKDSASVPSMSRVTNGRAGDKDNGSTSSMGALDVASVGGAGASQPVTAGFDLPTARNSGGATGAPVCSHSTPRSESQTVGSVVVCPPKSRPTVRLDTEDASPAASDRLTATTPSRISCRSRRAPLPPPPRKVHVKVTSSKTPTPASRPKAVCVSPASGTRLATCVSAEEGRELTGEEDDMVYASPGGPCLLSHQSQKGMMATSGPPLSLLNTAKDSLRVSGVVEDAAPRDNACCAPEDPCTAVPCVNRAEDLMSSMDSTRGKRKGSSGIVPKDSGVLITRSRSTSVSTVIQGGSQCAAAARGCRECSATSATSRPSSHCSSARCSTRQRSMRGGTVVDPACVAPDSRLPERRMARGTDRYKGAIQRHLNLTGVGGPDAQSPARCESMPQVAPVLPSSSSSMASCDSSEFTSDDDGDMTGVEVTVPPPVRNRSEAGLSSVGGGDLHGSSRDQRSRLPARQAGGETRSHGSHRCRGPSYADVLDQLAVIVEVAETGSEEAAPVSECRPSRDQSLDSSSHNCHTSGSSDHHAVEMQIPGSKFTVTRAVQSGSRGAQRLQSVPSHESIASGGPHTSSRDARLPSSSRGDSQHRQRSVTSSKQHSGGDGIVAKKLYFVVEVRDRQLDVALHTITRRYFGELVPAYLQVQSLSPALQSVTLHTSLPSVRYMSESSVEDCRTRVQAFLSTVVETPFLVRHPAMVNLLDLQRYLPGERGLSTKDAAVSLTDGRCGKTSVRSEELCERGGEVEGVASLRQRPSLPNGGTFPFPCKDRDLYRTDPMSEAALPTFYCRTPRRATSTMSVVSSTSSVGRRNRLDAVTTEDLERVQRGDLIGKGSFGSVFLGLLPTSSGSLMVAIKVLTLQADMSSEALRSVQTELHILRTARHRNVLRFLGSLYKEQACELHIFTEYVEGGSLHSMVTKFGCLSLVAIQKYMLQILSGLAHLHGLSIIHCDIKGDNIFVTKHGKIKLADFGCGSSLQACGSDSYAVGSPMWMAPEVIHGAAPTTACDIWALGCVGIEMLDRPIWNFSDTANPYVFIYRVGKANGAPHGLPSEEELSRFRDGPRDVYECLSLFRHFLMQCLHMDPKRRWSAVQLLQHPFLHTPMVKYLRWDASAPHS